MYMKIYNLVLQSSTGSGNTANSQFYFDWGQIPEGKYKVRFTFNSAVVTLNNTYVANIFLDLGQQVNTFIVPSTTLTTPQLRGNYLGTVAASGTGASQYLFADLHTNPPIYLNNRPTNNQLFVEIHQNTDPYQANYPSANIGQYTLNLSLTLLD